MPGIHPRSLQQAFLSASPRITTRPIYSMGSARSHPVNLPQSLSLGATSCQVCTHESADHFLEIGLSDTEVMPNILVANLPQVIISFTYIMYNSQFTAMLAQREWSNYAIKRAPLRVSEPSSGQRSTHFLQLPYTFSVPLLLASALLHWFISQSLFLARIAIYNDGIPTRAFNGMLETRVSEHSAVGFSYAATTASICLGALLIVVLLALSFYLKYPIGLPIGGTNSAVISAACHVRPEEKDDNEVVNRPLKWGVTKPGSAETVGHCAFSSMEVAQPEVDHLYA